jgi:hypothetical protein
MYAGKNNHSVENTPLFFPFSQGLWGACGGEKNGWLCVLNIGISNARSKAQTIKMRIEK